MDDAAARLQELRHEEWEDLGLAAVALALAIGATQVLPSLALPLFLGGLVIGGRGVRVLWRRWDLVDRLAGERDAYVLREVLEYASREATIERRQTFASLIRSRLERPEGALTARICAASGELEGLAAELADDELELDPASAVACARLLVDVETSPLLNARRPADELCSRVRQIRSGFSRRLAA